MEVHSWERPLLDLAHEALRSTLPEPVEDAEDERLLAQAYRHCDLLTAAHSRSFHLASSLLPSRKRRAIRALYAFCRVADDLADRSRRNRMEAFNAWRRRVLSRHPPSSDLVLVAWADTRTRYNIPSGCVNQFIDGVSKDMNQTRYASFRDLAAYAYGVASTVGLMSMWIIGYSLAAIPYAVKLGVALQLTNILRDVGEDLRAGRVYLPLDELKAFGLSEADLVAGTVDERWHGFMRFQIQRNRRLYAEARPGLDMLNRDGRFAIRAAAELYGGILDDIEAHGYDVFQRRAHLNALFRVWKVVTLSLGGGDGSTAKTPHRLHASNA